MIRILISDDHTVVRQGLEMFLALDPALEVVGEAKNGAEAIEQARLLKPDVVLMDLLMPVMGGIEAIGTLRAELKIESTPGKGTRTVVCVPPTRCPEPTWRVDHDR